MSIRSAWNRLIGQDAAQLVPRARLGGPMPWVMAIMIALTVIAAASGLSIANATRSAAAELRGGITVQIVEASADARNRQANAALALLRTTPAVRSARLVPESEMVDLLSPWLGADVASLGEAGALPIPALIDARLSGKSTPDVVRQLRARIKLVAPAARIDAQSGWLAPVFAALRSLQWLALALIALLAAATAAAVLLAARTALGTNRETIEVVHLLGGTDKQIAGVFQRSVAIDAAIGGIVGLGLGGLAIAVLGRQFMGLGSAMVGGGVLRPIDWALLGLLPVVGVVLAIITARVTVLRSLRNIL